MKFGVHSVLFPPPESSGDPFEPVSVNLPGIPDDVLEELAIALIRHNNESGLDDSFETLNEIAAFGTNVLLSEKGGRSGKSAASFGRRYFRLRFFNVILHGYKWGKQE